MKTIIEYQCEICSKRYKSEKEAIECESAGIFDPSIYPVGFMYEYNHNGYVGIFAIAPDSIEVSRFNSHHGNINWWACRLNNRDTLGDSLCGRDEFIYSDKERFDAWLRWHNISQERVGCPEFNRMVKYLKSQNITPCYHTGDCKLTHINN